MKGNNGSNYIWHSGAKHAEFIYKIQNSGTRDLLKCGRVWILKICKQKHCNCGNVLLWFREEPCAPKMVKYHNNTHMVFNTQILLGYLISLKHSTVITSPWRVLIHIYWKPQAFILFLCQFREFSTFPKHLTNSCWETLPWKLSTAPVRPTPKI